MPGFAQGFAGFAGTQRSQIAQPGPDLICSVMAVKRRAGAEAISVSSSDGSGSGGDFVWTPEREAELLEALICHKPAGLAKHFQMALLVSRLQVCPLAQFYTLNYAFLFKRKK